MTGRRGLRWLVVSAGYLSVAGILLAPLATQLAAVYAGDDLEYVFCGVRESPFLVGFRPSLLEIASEIAVCRPHDR